MNEDEFRQFRHTNNKVGIDLGVKDFIITSHIDNIYGIYFF